MSVSPSIRYAHFRRAIAVGDAKLLRSGRGTKPDLWLVEEEGARWIVKDFERRRSFVRRWLGPWLVNRELRAYRRLADHPAVPKLLGKVDRSAFAAEYRPGEIVSDVLAQGAPRGFLEALERAVEGLHERGVTHLDLRHRSNVLVGEDGRPVVIDFASAICFRPGGVFASTLGEILVWIDRRALAKWRQRASAV